MEHVITVKELPGDRKYLDCTCAWGSPMLLSPEATKDSIIGHFMQVGLIKTA